MSYPLEVKLEIQDKIKKGKKIKQINLETGISITTLDNWKKQLNNKNNTIDDINNEIRNEMEVSKQIEKLIIFGRFEEAYKLTEKYPNNCIIQYQKIKILIIKKCYAEAKTIGKRFEYYAPIQSQIATIAIAEGNYGKAKIIGEKFKNWAPIQLQMVIVAKEEGDYEKAKEIGERFKDYVPIQTLMSEIAIAMEEKAKKIEEKSKDYVPIKTQKPKMEVAMEEKAKEIEGKSEDYVPIKTQMPKMEVAIKEKDKERDKAKEVENRFIDTIKTILYYNKEDLELIEKIKSFKGISDYKRTIILLAVCEKLKRPYEAKKIFKETKENMKLERCQMQTLNKIMERIKNKKINIFDFGFYDEILNWHFDLELFEQYKNEQREKGEEIQSYKNEELKVKSKDDDIKQKHQQNTVETSSNNSKNLAKEFKASIAFKPSKILVEINEKKKQDSEAYISRICDKFTDLQSIEEKENTR